MNEETIFLWIIFPIFSILTFGIISSGIFFIFHHPRDLSSGIFRIIEVEHYDDEDISKIITRYKAEVLLGRYLWLIPMWSAIDLSYISEKYAKDWDVFEIENREELEQIVESHYRELQKEDQLIKKRNKLKKPKVISKFSLQ